MAKISTVTDTTMFQIKKWLGLNENPDGDTRIKLGEAAEMRNWRITKNGSLQIRPGTEMRRKFGAVVNDEWVGASIHGMWYGFVGTGNHLLVAAGTKLYEVLLNTTITTRSNIHFREFDVNELGTVNKDNRVEFFAYQGLVYIMDGVSYQKWDGTSGSIITVDGYVPTILTGCACSTGAGTTAEQANLLTGKRSVKYTVKAEDIVSNELTVAMQENPLASNTLTITDLVNGHVYVETNDPATTEIVKTTVTKNAKLYVTGFKLQNATIPTGPNVLLVEYDMGAENRSEIASMRCAEFFNGANENRVFLYGDGSNTCYYSGITDAGQPTAEYFPALNQIQIGEGNTPITSMIRHYSRLLCFKSNSAYSISYDTLTLMDGSVVPGFYVTPVNRNIGNAPIGQVRLVSNNPITIHNGNAYVWKSTSRSGALTYDERQAIIISDRIENSLKSMILNEIYTFDHDYDQEYYVCCEDEVLVYNYGFNVWYVYTDLAINSIVEIGHMLYFGMADGTLRLFTRNATYDYREDKTWVTWDGETEIPGFESDTPYRTKYFDPDPTRNPNGEEWFCYLIEGKPYYRTDDPTSLLPSGCDVMTDDGANEIDAYWRSGAMAFDRDWRRKYSMVLWLSVMPENNSKFSVTATSDKRGEYPEKMIVYGTSGFGQIDFANFSFGYLKIAQVKRVKLKVKRYAYYRLILESKSKENTATIISTDIQVRYASNVK